jgi:coenzyme F420-reducing hydrogenase beta subunit
MFVQKALSEGMPVVCLGDTGHEFRMMRLDNIDDMQKARGSIYHSVSLHDTIDLLRDSPRPALLVSIPCQLAGIKKYIQTVEPALESKIAMIVGLICGWQFTDHAIKAFAAHNKIKPQPERTEYRGEDRAGKLKIHNETGQVLTYDRRVFENKGELNIYKSSFARYANRMRCRICQDHLNVLADIAVGDAWIKAAEGRKLSIIDVRSSRARLWFDNMVNDNQIVITGTGGIPELEESQSSNLVYGITARRLSAYLHGKGRLVTRFIYKEGINPVPPLGADEKISFDIEMLLRSTLRKGLYRLYLALYIIRNALEPRVQKLYKKIKRK